MVAVAVLLVWSLIGGIAHLFRGIKLKKSGKNQELAERMIKEGRLRVTIPIILVAFFWGCNSFSKLAAEKKEANFIVYAAENKDYELVKELLESGVPADANAYNFFKGNFVSSSNSDTALYEAAFWNDYEMAELLLQYGADPERELSMNNTPFLEAMRAKDYKMMRLFLTYGADPNHVLNSGNTYLVRACRSADETAVRILLEYGADPNVKDNEGVFLLEYENTLYQEQKYKEGSAIETNCRVIIKLLKEYGAVLE